MILCFKSRQFLHRMEKIKAGCCCAPSGFLMLRCYFSRAGHCYNYDSDRQSDTDLVLTNKRPWWRNSDQLEARVTNQRPGPDIDTWPMTVTRVRVDNWRKWADTGCDIIVSKPESDLAQYFSVTASACQLASASYSASWLNTWNFPSLSLSQNSSLFLGNVLLGQNNRWYSLFHEQYPFNPIVLQNHTICTRMLRPLHCHWPLTPCLLIIPWWAVQLVESNLVQAAVFHQLPHEAQGSEVVNEEKM